MGDKTFLQVELFSRCPRYETKKSGGPIITSVQPAAASLPSYISPDFHRQNVIGVDPWGDRKMFKHSNIDCHIYLVKHNFSKKAFLTYLSPLIRVPDCTEVSLVPVEAFLTYRSPMPSGNLREKYPVFLLKPF